MITKMIGLDDAEIQSVKYALRGYACVWEERAHDHANRGYTAAAMAYMQDVWRVREVLHREFGDAE